MVIQNFHNSFAYARTHIAAVAMLSFYQNMSENRLVEISALYWANISNVIYYFFYLLHRI